MAVTERRSPTRPGCARTPTAGSTSASTTGRSRSGAQSARASNRLLSALRAPAVAGRFYPGARGELEGVVRGLLDEAAPAPPAAPDPEAHRAEHAVEVEVPFLQLRRPGVRIVPLVLAWDEWEGCRLLGAALAELVREWPEGVLLLASSDLNHYEPAGVSEPKDRRALEALVALDGAELLVRCRREHISMCG